MRAKVSVELRPFRIPEAVGLTDEQGDITVATVKLVELDEDVLSALCDEFRAGVFEAAGKTDPRLK